MPNIQVPITALPEADFPLDGDEIMVLVQDGATVQAPIDTTLSAALFGPEFSLALPAGQSDNVPVAGNRALIDTSAGDVTITGFDATSIQTGFPLIVTNTGSNSLTLADSNGGSLTANQIYAITDMTLPPKGTFLLERSGTLLKWVLVS